MAGLFVIGLLDEQVEGEDAAALLLAMGTVADRDRLGFALQCVTHGAAKAAAFSELHEIVPMRWVAPAGAKLSLQGEVRRLRRRSPRAPACGSEIRRSPIRRVRARNRNSSRRRRAGRVNPRSRN